jgi:UDP-N-acetylmuramate dehydrogenase
VRSAGGRRRYDAFTRSLCARLTLQLASIVPTFQAGGKLLVGQREKLEFSLRELRRSADVELHERVDLRAWTSLGVGGVATLVVRCHNAISVAKTLDLAASHGLGWVVLGSGSRIIASDRGIRVPVVSATGELARWKVEVDGIEAGAGANLAQVCRAARRTGLSGLESLDIGDHSVGGLLRAAIDGVFNLGSVLDWIDLQAPGCGELRWHATDDDPIPDPQQIRRKIITRIRFRLRPSSVAWVQPGAVRSSRSRALRSTGPIFLDSQDATAADLLAEAGCRNLTIGGVRIGGTRGNELIAGRSATSADVLDLCRRARERVVSATSVELVPALVFVDEDGLKITL